MILYLHQSQFNYFTLHSSFKYSSKKIVGKRIKKLRTKRNMTLQQLADLIKADRQYVWNIENGDVNLTLDYIDRIAKALEVSQSEFINTNI
ncbi:MAG: helix-turn-helix domain-containing protein [Bacteroidia bacterium]